MKNTLKIIFLAVIVWITATIFISKWGVEQTSALHKAELTSSTQADQALKERQIEINEQKKIYLLGKFDPATMPGFVPVPNKYSVSGYQMYLRKETLDAYEDMRESADADGVNLKIASATRNFEYQKSIWNKKWNLSKFADESDKFEDVLEYSAAPGTSRHHWGTDIDINGATPEYFETETGEKVYDWLNKNAAQFGFCQPYNAGRQTGYYEEKWHWSYLPLAKNFTQEYKDLIKETDIKGFDGDEYVTGQDLITNYVLGINPDCI